MTITFHAFQSPVVRFTAAVALLLWVSLAVVLKAPAAPPPESAPAPAPLKIHLVRRHALTEEELRQQLQHVRELDLDTEPAKVVPLLARARKESDFTTETVTLTLLKGRTDLAGLPLRMGAECHTDEEAAKNLKSLSRKLREHLETLAQWSPHNPVRPTLRSRLRLPEGKAYVWLEPEAIPALQQLLAAEDKDCRLVLVEVLARIDDKRATAGLVQRALFDLHAEVRAAALLALQTRPAADVDPLLLAGFRYPWDVVANHAAEALVALKRRDLVPELEKLGDKVKSAGPFRRREGDQVRELVRINHLGNCVLCHAPSTARTDLVRGIVPRPGERLRTSTPQYDQREDPEALFVRADITYLRQDFSVVQPVEWPREWPKNQRFDYVVCTRPTRPEELSEAGGETWSERQQAILFAIRALRGESTEAEVAGWWRYQEGRVVRVTEAPRTGKKEKPLDHCGSLAGVAVDGKGNVYVSDEFTNTIYRVGPNGAVTVVLESSRGCAGLQTAPDGRLFICEAGAGRVIAFDPEKKSTQVLASEYQGRGFNGPRHLTLDQEGGFYFTDPADDCRNDQNDSAVYHVSSTGTVTCVLDTMYQPWGIALSPRDRTLYLTAGEAGVVWAVPVEGPGRLAKEHSLVPLPSSWDRSRGGQGLTVDADGNLYVTQRGERTVRLVAPSGKVLQTLAVPEVPAACALGSDGKIAVAAETSLYALKLPTPSPAKAK
jgi:gluconolactonase